MWLWWWWLIKGREVVVVTRWRVVWLLFFVSAIVVISVGYVGRVIVMAMVEWELHFCSDDERREKR
jgi:hypothetical protein